MPVTPSAVAEMVAAPSLTAVASPVSGSTVATGLSPLVHANTMPGMGVPSASRASAVNCCVIPSAVSVAVPGVTTIVVGTGGDVNSTVALSRSAKPSSAPATVAIPAVELVRVAVYLPSARSVTAERAPSVDVSVTVPSLRVSGLPPPSTRFMAITLALVPSAGAVAGSAVIVLSSSDTSCSTVSVAVPVTPSAVAEMVAAPSLTAVASPVSGSTVATGLSPLVHANTMPGMGVPSASRASAVNCCVAPRLVSIAVAWVTTMVGVKGGVVNSTVASSRNAAPSSVPVTVASPGAALVRVAV